MLTYMAMRLVILDNVLLLVLSCFRGGGGGGEGGWGGMLTSMAIIFSMSFQILLCGGRICFVTVC